MWYKNLKWTIPEKNPNRGGELLIVDFRNSVTFSIPVKKFYLQITDKKTYGNGFSIIVP